MRIAIVGGSLGGLFAAALLHQTGHEIFERSPSGLEGRGAGLVGQGETCAILRVVGCEHVARVGVVATERIFLDRSGRGDRAPGHAPAVSYTHLRAHETRHDLVCRLLLEKKKTKKKKKNINNKKRNK